MKRSFILGRTLLGVWLVATNLLPFVPLGLPGLATLLHILGLVAGILVLMGR